MAKGKKTESKIVDLRGRLGIGPVLDELIQIFAEGNHDLAEASAVLQQGVNAFGKKAIIDELCRRLRQVEGDDDSTAIVWSLEEVGDPEAIGPLREIVHAPHLAPRVRTDAAVVLHALGEPVDVHALPAPGPEDLEQILGKILDDTEQQLDRVESSERAFTLNELFDEIIRFAGKGNSGDMLRVLIQALGEQQRPVAVDMLWVLREFSSEVEVRAQAGQVLEEAEARGLKPDPDMVAGTSAGAFAQAFVSDMGPQARQGQVLFTWEQRPDNLLLFSFLIDFVHWGGAIKDFFLKPSAQPEEVAEIVAASEMHGIPMVEIPAAEARQHIARALQANVEQVRPLPLEYRRFHPLVTRTLFGGVAPIELPEAAEEARSPLPERAGAVEELLRDRMPAAGFDREQVLNARMLWRDFYQSQKPRISKAEVWAAAVGYIIGWLEERRDQTQPAVAEHYGVSAGSVSKRAGEIWDRFLEVEQGSMAYTTDQGRLDPIEEAMEGLGDLLGDKIIFPDSDEDWDLEYQEYLEEYEEFGAGTRKLARAEFEQLTEELDALAELEELEELSAAQGRRLQELERLLLLD